MVYRGDDLRLGRPVAIKIMHAHLADDPNFTRRFEQEAKSAAGLGHPNIVNVFDQGEWHGVPYLVMEHLSGMTLRELLKQRQRLTPEEASDIAEAVLSGLAAAHEAGIVHRDVKPENVLLADDGRIKIGDFGLARAVSANTTTGQALLGTIAYLSPELVTRGIADERSDIYAFGIMLFEMLTGKQPYTGDQPMQIAYQHAHSDVPPPSSLVPEIPQEYDRLVQWATQRDADARPSDGREALDYIRALRSGEAGAVTSVLPATTVFDNVTPVTTVLSDADRGMLGVPTTALPAEALAGAAAGMPGIAESTEGAAPATERASARAKRRSRRGGWIAAIVALLIALAGGAGLYWGIGPGSLVQIPDVSGMQPDEAQQLLETNTFTVTRFDCTSLDVTEGLVVRTEPEAGRSVARGSEIRLCTSIGPEMLPVPTLVGLSLDDAKAAITNARFAFGSVVDERFDGGTAGTVILAVGPDGNGLADSYPEQGVINLITSAGSVPDVAGLTSDTATQALTRAGLNVDLALNTESFSDDVEKGHAIRVLTDKETLSVGDSVGLEISKGPELFPVPDVAAQGLSVNDAAKLLRDQGFEVDSGLIEVGSGAGDLIGVKRTVPAAGEMVPKGTVVSFRYI